MSNFFAKPVEPWGLFRRWVNGLSIGELALYGWLLAPQIWFTVFRMRDAAKEWDAGEVDEVHDLPTWNRAQYVIERLGLHFSFLFLCQAPFLFIPVIHGSVIRDFFGVKYGTAIKFHRYAGPRAVSVHALRTS